MPNITLNRSTIHYQEQGSGKPVLLLHGFPLDSRIWAGQIARLADRYCVIAPDLHAFGQSTADKPSTMASMVQDLRDLCKQLDLGPCAVGGLSMGGYVALEWIKTCPTDIKALMLVDTKPDADNTGQKNARQVMIEQAKTGGAKAVADAMLPKMLSPEHLNRGGDLVAKLRDIMETQSPQAIQWALAAMCDRQDYNDVLPAIADPTLLIFGEHDAITPPSIGQSMQDRIPRSQLEVIEAAGHLSPLEKPDDVADVMNAFLDACY